MDVRQMIIDISQEDIDSDGFSWEEFTCRTIFEDLCKEITEKSMRWEELREVRKMYTGFQGDYKRILDRLERMGDKTRSNEMTNVPPEMGSPEEETK